MPCCDVPQTPLEFDEVFDHERPDVADGGHGAVAARRVVEVVVGAGAGGVLLQDWRTKSSHKRSQYLCYVHNEGAMRSVICSKKP